MFSSVVLFVLLMIFVFFFAFDSILFPLCTPHSHPTNLSFRSLWDRVFRTFLPCAFVFRWRWQMVPLAVPAK
uniref:Putative secreted protein n=1 Tax=Anopheles darlingi TaxID=43151 RepID=A0A2M4DJF0_ANODA